MEVENLAVPIGKISDRPEAKGAFMIEMLTVYLFRWFTIELVEYIANRRGGIKAANLNPEISRYLGIETRRVWEWLLF